MTKTVTFHPKQGIRIPAKFLREAGFKEKKVFILKVKTPGIHITPQKQRVEEEKDWLDEALETPEGKAYFREIIAEAQEDIKKGRLYPVEEVFTEIHKERERK